MPSLLRYLAGLPAAKAAFQSLRHVASSGDVLNSAAARETRAALPAQAVLWNVYGCSECTADALAHPVASGVYLSSPYELLAHLRALRLFLVPAGVYTPEHAEMSTCPLQRGLLVSTARGTYTACRLTWRSNAAHGASRQWHWRVHGRSGGSR